MPLTTLDSISALVTIDLQKGIAGMPTVHPMPDIIGQAARMAKAFRDHHLSVVLVNVAGRAPGRTDAPPWNATLPPDWTDLVPELAASPSDHRVTKERWGAFLGTDLDAYLKGKGVTQIVLAGVATSIGVESTARSAYDLGYNVTLILDAMTDRDPEAHRYSVEKIFPRLGETGLTDDLLRLVAAR